ELPLIEEAGDGARLLSNQAWGLRAFLARNTMRLGRISKRMRTPMFLIDSHGKRPVCVACHRLGSYQEAEPDVFIWYVCQGTTVKIGQRRIAGLLGVHVETVNVEIHELEGRQHIAIRGTGRARRIYHLS